MTRNESEKSEGRGRVEGYFPYYSINFLIKTELAEEIKEIDGQDILPLFLILKGTHEIKNFILMQ